MELADKDDQTLQSNSHTPDSAQAKWATTRKYKQKCHTYP